MKLLYGLIFSCFVFSMSDPCVRIATNSLPVLAPIRSEPSTVGKVIEEIIALTFECHENTLSDGVGKMNERIEELISKEEKIEAQDAREPPFKKIKTGEELNEDLFLSEEDTGTTSKWKLLPISSQDKKNSK